MLSTLAIIGAATLISAQTTTTPAADATKLPECTAAAQCLTGCRGKQGEELKTCFTDCAAKNKACQDAIATAVRARFMQQQSDIQAKVDALKAQYQMWLMGSVAEAQMRCNTLCDTKAPTDKVTDCKAVCAGITDVKTGLQAAATLIQAAVKAKLDAAIAANPDSPQAQAVKDALSNLRDSIATQRAFFSDARAAVAAALDMRAAAIQAAREDRQAKIDAAKAATADFIAKFKAATTQEDKDKLKADAKAAVQKAIDDAKAAWEAAKAAWADKKKALVDKVIAANKTRKDNRLLIIGDIKNLKVAVADLKKSLQAVDPSAEAEPAAMTKRQAGTTATVVVSCSVNDPTCYAAVNTALAAAVDADGDVTLTETTSDEVNYAPEALPGDEATATTTKKAEATEKPGKNSASSYAALGLSALVCVAVALF